MRSGWGIWNTGRWHWPAGGIAQAYHRTIPDYIIKEVKHRLDRELLKVVKQFSSKYSLL